MKKVSFQLFSLNFFLIAFLLSLACSNALISNPDEVTITKKETAISTPRPTPTPLGETKNVLLPTPTSIPVEVITTIKLDDASLGKQLVEKNGCIACHSSDGSVIVGPSWKNLFGSSGEFEDGTSIKSKDVVYITESILEPNKKIVKGFQPNLMPTNYSEVFTKEEITTIIAYLKTLN